MTNGGSPDSAYKIGKFLQSQYSEITIYVPGYCKSAGTLLAIAANTLMFGPYGELGPLDIQMEKRDDFTRLESGLNITEALITLEERAKEAYHELISEIIVNSGGIISFQMASHSAGELIGNLYGPLFAKFDPDEVGSRARAMKICEDYGIRLNNKYSNLKPGAITFLTRFYPNHRFVIDCEEAKFHFMRVQIESTELKNLIQGLGVDVCFPSEKLIIHKITDDHIVDQEINSEL